MEYLKVAALGAIVGILFVIQLQLQIIIENQTAAVVEYSLPTQYITPQ